MGTGMGAQPTLTDWLVFGAASIAAIYAFVALIADRIPALRGLGAPARRSLGWLLWQFPEAVGAWAEELILTLWRGPTPAPAARPLSTVSGTPQAPLMSRPGEDTAKPPTDRGLSGLSAPIAPPAQPDPGDAWIESLDTGSRQRAIALLVRDGWGVGKIRKIITGDNDAIGREVAEARRQLGLVEEEAPRTPVAGRELGEGVEFRRQPTA